MTLAPLRTVGVTRYHRPQKSYTSIRNSFVRNARIRLRAFRVGVVVLSHAAGFVQTQAQLAAVCDMSVTTVRAALRDLERDGYLACRVVREHGRIVGTAYAISDTPFTHAELVALTSEDVTSAPCTNSEHTKSVPPNKTRSRRDSSPGEEDQPPGGVADAPAVLEIVPTEEDDVPIQTDPAQAQLFDMPSQEPPAAEARKPEGAQAVVAAYVEGWRESNPEGEPLRAAKGRIARDAKAMLTKGEATVVELSTAARAMASGPFSNLGVQLNILRRGRGRTATVGHAEPRPKDYQGWAEGAAEDAARRAAEPISPELQALRARYVQVGVA